MSEHMLFTRLERLFCTMLTRHFNSFGCAITCTSLVYVFLDLTEHFFTWSLCMVWIIYLPH